MILKMTKVHRITGLLLIAELLSACGSKPKTADIAQTRQERYRHAMTLEGLVSNDSGPVKTGVVKALSENGATLTSVQLEGESRYKLDLPAGTLLPLILTYSPDPNAPESQSMMTVAIHANTSKYDINPASSRISKQAKSLGGYTHSNLVRAAESTGIVPADNKTTAGFRGDPTKQYGGWH